MNDLTEKMPLTDRELRALDALWRHGPTTLPDLRAADEIAEPYTSTLSVYQQLRDKGLVVVPRNEGAAYVWAAAHDREQIGESMLRWVRDRLYGGDGERFAAHLRSVASAA